MPRAHRRRGADRARRRRLARDRPRVRRVDGGACRRARAARHPAAPTAAARAQRRPARAPGRSARRRGARGAVAGRVAAGRLRRRDRRQRAARRDARGVLSDRTGGAGRAPRGRRRGLVGLARGGAGHAGARRSPRGDRPRPRVPAAGGLLLGGVPGRSGLAREHCRADAARCDGVGGLRIPAPRVLPSAARRRYAPRPPSPSGPWRSTSPRRPSGHLRARGLHRRRASRRRRRPGTRRLHHPGRFSARRRPDRRPRRHPRAGWPRLAGLSARRRRREAPGPAGRDGRVGEGGGLRPRGPAPRTGFGGRDLRGRLGV